MKLKNIISSICAGVVLGLSAAVPVQASAAELTLYSGQHKNATDALIAAFEAKTGIKVNARYGKSNELAHQIMEEGADSPADIIYTEESTPLVMLANKGLLAELDDTVIDVVAEDYRDSHNQWVGVLARSRTVVYDPKLINEADLPKSIFDLQNPQWEGKFAFVPSSGAFQAQLSAMIKLKGYEQAKAWLEGIKKYGKIYRKNTVVLDAVERGEVPFGLINNYYWDKQAKEKGIDNMNSRLYYFGTRDIGDMLTIASIGVLKSSPNQQQAEEFVAFALSPEGQQLLTDLSAQYPLNKSVKTHPSLKPFSELTPPAGTIDLGEYGDGKAAVNLLQEVGLL